MDNKIEEENLSKKEIALNKAGATRERAYKAYVEALGATITKYDREGDVLGVEPDFPTRIKAADSISRLNGDMKEGVLVDNRQINIGTITVESMSILINTVKDVNEQLRLLPISGQQTGEIIDVEG